MENDTAHLENAKEKADEPLTSHALLADLEKWMMQAEKRYREKQQDGDAISIASTRGTFLAIHDARDLVRWHFPANAQDDESPPK